MKFTVNSVTRCSGQNHLDVTVTVNGETRTIELTRADLAFEPDEMRAAAVSRLRSAVKEAGATSWTLIRAALVGREFQI